MDISKLLESLIDLIKWIVFSVYYFFKTIFVTDSLKTYENKKVFIINNLTLKKRLKELDTLNDEYYIGLDCEWVPGDKDISIIQIATKCYIFIFQTKYLSTIPIQLQRCLENVEIIKSGVGIKNDADLIYRNYEIVTNNILDLMKLHKSLYGINGYGLEKLCNEFLGVNHFKIPINHHQWSNKVLTNQQVLYAAGDAWASREILSSLYYMFVPDKLDKNTLFKWVKSIDYSKNSSNNLHTRNHHNHNNNLINKENHINNNEINEKENCNNDNYYEENRQKDKEPTPYRTRCNPLYENCHVYHPDGRLMFICSRRKFDWYLRKKIAVQISDSPPSIQLNFKPNGFGKAVEFMLTPEDNKCVVCGKTEKYVPHFYRQYFPFHMKSHCSHDVLLLCMNCHLKCSEFDYQFSIELHNQYNIEYNNSKVKIDEELNGIIKSAKALIKNSNQMPEDKIEEKYNKIKTYLNKEEITNEDLNSISNLSPRLNVNNIKSSGYVIVQSILDKEGEKGIECFVKLWRKNFYDKMQPKFLPKFWAIENPIENKDMSVKVNKKIIQLSS